MLTLEVVSPGREVVILSENSIESVARQLA